MRTWRSRHAPHPKTGASTIMDFEEEVKTHTRRVEAGRTGTLWPSVSPLWSGRGRVLSDARLSSAEVPAGRRSGTSRWRCPGSCGGGACAAASGSPTTRPFALPRKRFVKPPVLEKAGEYLGTEHSYRKTVEHEGMPIMYDDRKPDRGEAAGGLGSQHGLAVVVVAGRDARHAAGRLGADSPERAQLHAAPPAVGRAVLRSTAREQRQAHAPAGDAVAGGGPRMRGTFRPGNLPPLCNRPRLVVR